MEHILQFRVQYSIDLNFQDGRNRRGIQPYFATKYTLHLRAYLQHIQIAYSHNITSIHHTWIYIIAWMRGMAPSFCTPFGRYSTTY